MPWETVNVVEQRIRFIALAEARIMPFSELCAQFKISRTTGYKWVERTKDVLLANALCDRSRRPRLSPGKTPSDIEKALVALRKERPYWGARKIAVLFSERYPGYTCPGERTINRIFARNDLLGDTSPQGVAYNRFEYEHPNDLWQMDYKGEFLYDGKHYCYPLDVLDDHSRYNIMLDVHLKIGHDETRASLTGAFRRYGLPHRMLMDRGQVWYAAQASLHWTRLTVWLMKLGIELIHSRGRHPQTLGKAERFHRTLKYDLIKRTTFNSFDDVQNKFNVFRDEYNHLRPHDGIGLKRPAEIYEVSTVPFTDKEPTIEYPAGSIVKRLTPKGMLCYKGHYWFICESLPSEYVMLIEKEHGIDVYFNKTHVRTVNLNTDTTSRV